MEIDLKGYTGFLTEADKRNPLFLGLELEMEVSQDHALSTVKQYLLTFPFIHSVESDSTIRYGWEARLQPMTFNWIRENQTTLNTLLTTMCSQYGATAYNTTSCGGHIHMSRNAFKHGHLYRFLHFMYAQKNREAWVTVSCRRKSLLNTWAPFERNDSRTEIREKARQGWGCGGVVRMRPNTVEMRLFRGTLALDGLMRNYGFCDASFRFTKGSKLENRTVEGFYQWLKVRPQYQALTEFLERKKLISL